PPDRLVIRRDQPKMRVYRNIRFQDRPVGKLMVTLDVSRQLAERDQAKLALVGGNAAFTLLLATFGYLLTRRMTRPMQILSEHLDQSGRGVFQEVEISEAGRSGKEATAMFASFNAMVRAVNERDALRTSLHEEEKLADLGRLAAAMAHEINNPLGGMLNTLETLKRHGGNVDVQKKSVGLLERGLRAIGDVVQTSLLAYRERSTRHDLSEKDLSDLRHLLRPEIRRHAQSLDWKVGWSGALPLDGSRVRRSASTCC
ncbi:MAG: histidine kinase dimerization/phospho-acceptor domain-containing protein, partial [Paracoccaceae bacterium]